MTRMPPAGSLADRWVRMPKDRGGCRIRLFCLPHAGGSASTFAGWQQLLPDAFHVCPVQLPARQNRLTEEPFTKVEPLVRALADVLDCSRPFALFGHSMGALVAFELARELRRRGGSGPALLLVASCRAPQVPSLALPMAGLPDAAFVAALRKFRGLPPAFLDHPELVDLVLPALRADVALCEAYSYTPEPPLDHPISVYGSTDPNDVSFAELSGWRQQTRAAFRMHTFRGSHFFLSESRPGLLKVIQEDLSRVCGDESSSASS